MVNGKQFEKEVKKNQVCFAIVLRGLSVGSNDRAAKVGNNRVIAEIAKLLNEYKDIVAEDIPNYLPPVEV